MNPIEFIFRLLEKYAPVSLERKDFMKSEAMKWYSSPQVSENAIGAFVRKYGETWWVMMLLCILYIFAIRWIHDFMNPESDVVDEDDEI